MHSRVSATEAKNLSGKDFSPIQDDLFNASPMRILKISDVYFPRVNGVSTSIRTFSQELLRQGHHVTLIVPEYTEPYEEEDGFHIIRIPSYYIPMDPEDRYMRPGLIRKRLTYLKEQQFDVLHIHTPFVAHYQGMSLARQLNIPVVGSYHTYFEEYFEEYLPWFPRKVLRYAARYFSRSQCRQLDQIVVPTQPMLQVLRRYGIQDHVSVIPTGIPENAFTQGDAAVFRQRFAVADERPIMLYVGRVAHEKNIDFLLDVTHQVRQKTPDILFVIVGDGPALKRLKKRSIQENLSQHIRFTGYLSSKHALPDCYAAANIFIFASNTETQGLVLLEAMQAGVPVVSTAVMGTAEVMQDGRGGLVSAENVKAFSQAVTDLLKDTELHAKCSQEGKLKAAEWSVSATTQQLINVYQNLVDAKH